MVLVYVVVNASSEGRCIEADTRGVSYAGSCNAENKGVDAEMSSSSGGDSVLGYSGYR